MSKRGLLVAGRSVVSLLVLAALSACSSPPAGSAGAAPTSAEATSPPAETASASASPSAGSIICDFFAEGGGGKDIQAAAMASFSGDNEALPLRAGIDKTKALAQRAQDAEEKRDLLSLASALDGVALSGGSFADWDPAYEAFYVKYATRCGQPISP